VPILNRRNFKTPGTESNSVVPVRSLHSLETNLNPSRHPHTPLAGCIFIFPEKRKGTMQMLRSGSILF